MIATPSVAFAYDTNYNRLTIMTDGTGTNIYSYYPVTSGQLGAGRLKSIAGPLSNGIVTNFYDALGRITNRAINGVTNRAINGVTGSVNGIVI